MVIKLKIISEGDNFKIYLISKKNEELDLKRYVKKIIIKLKNKMNKYIEGYYNVNVYVNEIYGIVIELEKTGDFDFFKDFLELNIKIYENSKMYYKFSDYFTLINKNNIYYFDNNYYIDIENLNKKELLYITDFGEITYGKKLNNIISNLKKVDMCYNKKIINM